MRTYLILSKAVTEHDAVGNEIAIMAELFSGIGRCLVYAEERRNPRLKYVEAAQLPALLQDNDTIAVYHHSTCWAKGEEYLRMADGRQLIRYHGVTPPEYYHDYNADVEEACRLGREQTLRMAAELKKARWLCDSAFLASELRGIAAAGRVSVFPLFHRTEDWANASPGEALLRELVFNDKLNLLFVGRAAPQRKVEMLLDILRIYRENYGDTITLRMLGRQDPELESYYAHLRALVEEYGLSDCVYLLGEVSEDQMSAYYLGCDFFISVSEHEGFCVPIVEAQYYKMPVILRDAAALPETGGEGALVLGDDAKEYAAALHVLRQREDLRRWLRNRGRENYERRFNADWMKQRFRGILKEYDMV